MTCFINYDVQAYTHCTVTPLRQLCLLLWTSYFDVVQPSPSQSFYTKTQFIWLGNRRRLANVDRCLVAKTFLDLGPCFVTSWLDHYSSVLVGLAYLLH